MNVCHVINRLSSGGAPSVVKYITNEDVENNHYVYCMEDIIEINEEDINATIVEGRERFKFNPNSIYSLYKFLHQIDCNVLHLHLPYAQTVGRLIAKIAPVNHIISTQHNIPQSHHIVTRYLELVTRCLDEVTVAVSDGVIQSNKQGIPKLFDKKTNWVTIYNGINVTQFNTKIENADPTQLQADEKDENELIFINVSRYIPQKSHSDMIAAMKQVVDIIPQARLFLIGRGALEEQIRNEVRKHDLEENITVTGYVTQEDLYRYYSLADAFVLSSLKEGFGIVLVEAMAAELPVVATDIPGVNEVVDDGTTGELVPINDPESLAEAMCSLRNSEVRKRYAENGYNRAKELFSVKQSASKYHNVYKSIVD